MQHDKITAFSTFFRIKASKLPLGSAAKIEPRRPVGIYVSDKSEGHRRRAIAIAKQAPDYFTLLGSGLKGKSDALAIVDLPCDPCPDAAYSVSNAGQSRRLSRIAAWIDCAKPALMLIDSCVEVAALAREKNVPTVYMRLAGKRNDAAHLQAFAAAEAVLCPFHALLEAEDTPQWLKSRSRYFPGLTENDNFCANTDSAAVSCGQEPIMLIIAGHDCGGKKHMAVSAAQLAAAAASLPGWRLQVAGRACPAELQAKCPANLQFYAHVSNLNNFIRCASLVVGAASDCLIAAVAAAGKPFICLPQRRPFDEQAQKAERLAALRAATLYRRWPRNWPKAAAQTLKRGSVLAALHEENAAARAAQLLLNLAYDAAHNAAAAYAEQAAGAAAAEETALQAQSMPQQKLAVSSAVAARGVRRVSLLWQKSGARISRPRRVA